MKRILVTGGAGFIGSHLCRTLLDAGNQVYCLDNFFTGHKKNIEDLKDNKNFLLIEHDVKEKFFINVDEIYNLACPASPKNYQIDPVNTIHTCVLGAINVLSIAKTCNAKVLQSSTSEVYGDPLVSPQVEEYWGNVNPIGIRSCYDEGKRCAESLFINYNKEYDTQIKIARIFNTFGPNLSANDGRVVSNFIVQCLLDKDITIYGSGDQTRSFCYVDDTVRGLISLMETDSSVYNPVNIGNPNEFSIKEMANKIIDLTGSTSKIIFYEGSIDDPKRRLPDITKAMKLLRWSPEVSLDDGLIKTIDYFRKILCL